MAVKEKEVMVIRRKNMIKIVLATIDRSSKKALGVTIFEHFNLRTLIFLGQVSKYVH